MRSNTYLHLTPTPKGKSKIMRTTCRNWPSAYVQIWNWCGCACLCDHMCAHVHGQQLGPGWPVEPWEDVLEMPLFIRKVREQWNQNWNNRVRWERKNSQVDSCCHSRLTKSNPYPKSSYVLYPDIKPKCKDKRRLKGKVWKQKYQAAKGSCCFYQSQIQ